MGLLQNLVYLTCVISAGAQLPGNYAHCNVVPLSEEQTISGGIFLKQTMRGPLEVHVQLSGFDPDAGHSHELHVHEFGDLSDGCSSLGGHFNPDGTEHASEEHDERHVGDLGFIECDDKGESNSVVLDTMATLFGRRSIIGRSLAIHEAEGSGKLACCVIGKSSEDTWQAMHMTMHGEHDGHDHGDHEGHEHENHDPSGHDHGNHEGHDHGDHEGHDHGNHEGHDHGSESDSSQSRGERRRAGRRRSGRRRGGHQHSGHQHSGHQHGGSRRRSRGENRDSDP